MRRRTPSFVWWIVGIGGGLTLLVLGLLALFVGSTPNGADAQAFDAAERTWQARSLSHYRITTGTWAPWGPTSGCVQEIEVQNTRVTEVVQNTCSMPITTVSHLFGRIKPFVRHQVCGAGGCLCDGYVVVKAEYDAQFGYPRSINISLEQSRFVQTFFRLSPWKWNNCSLMGTVTEPGILVLSFTPLR